MRTPRSGIYRVTREAARENARAAEAGAEDGDPADAEIRIVSPDLTPDALAELRNEGAANGVSVRLGAGRADEIS